MKIGANARRDIEAYYSPIRDLVLYVNSACNLRCKHCYIGTPLLDASRSFDTDDAGAFIRSFDSLSRITILGGEPLLHRGINSILRAALETPIDERRLTTNLTGLFHLDSTLLVGAPITLAVSLDGPTAELHDSIRGSGTFSKTASNLERMLSRGVDIEVSHTVTASSVEHLEELLKLCRAMGVKKLNLHKMSLQGNATDNADLWITPTRWLELCRQIEGMDRGAAAQQSVGTIRLRYPRMYATREEVSALMRQGLYWPQRARSYYAQDTGRRIVLYPNGRVYVSSELFGTDSHLGTIDNNTFTVNSSEANEVAVSVPDEHLPAALVTHHPMNGSDLLQLSVSFKRTVIV